MELIRGLELGKILGEVGNSTGGTIGETLGRELMDKEITTMGMEITPGLREVIFVRDVRKITQGRIVRETL